MNRRNIFLKKSIVVFFACILVISISSTQKTKDKNSKNNINPKNINKPINNQPPKVSKCWFLDIGQYIDGDGSGVGAHNWTWARNQDWCRKGDGSAGNPYVIENITIDGHWIYNCLWIEDSYKYFKINNCTFIHSIGGGYAGLVMANVGNGTIINSYFESNLGQGIRTVNGNNITIRDSFITNNTISGILLEGGCQYINIIGNTIKNNTLGLNLTNYAMDNVIYLNKFINNRNHAHDNNSEYSPNHWNSTTIGNYWDNYTGSDITGDCIGETPQKISGPAGNFDYHPLLLCYWQHFYGASENDDDDDDNGKSSSTLDKVLSFIKTPLGMGIVAGIIIALIAIIIIIKKHSR